jgi:tight adherence protein B
VSAALLGLAAALLAWPDPAAARRARLARAGPRPVRWTTDRLGPVPAAVVAAAVGAALSTPVVAALAAGCAALAARTWRARRRATREEDGLRALIAVLGAFAADLRAGRPLEAAAASAARGAGDDHGQALLRAVRTAAGPGSAAAGPEPDALRRLSAAVALSARTGASLADVVTALEDDLRARQRHRLELRSALAAPRASAGLLAGLPVLGVAMGSGVGADPWHVLTGTGTGQVLLVVGVGLEVAGMVWSNRLVARVTRSGAVAVP